MGRRTTALSLLVVAGLSCGGSGRDESDAVEVVVRDYEVEAPQEVASGAAVLFRIFNDGPTVHELVLIRTDISPSRLPLATDGVTADEEGLAPIAANEYIAVGDDGPLIAELRKGRYVLFCNLPGHYQAGMHAGIVVT